MSRKVHRGSPELSRELLIGVPERLRGRLSLEPASAFEASDARARISSSVLQDMPGSYRDKRSSGRCDSCRQLYNKMQKIQCLPCSGAVLLCKQNRYVYSKMVFTMAVVSTVTAARLSR